MKKLHPLLSVLFLIYWSCEDKTETGVTLWGVVYSIENTTELSLRNRGPIKLSKSKFLKDRIFKDLAGFFSFKNLINLR